MKKCTRCKLDKHQAEFSTDNSRKDKLQVYCKTCYVEIRQIGNYDAYAKRKNYTVNWQRQYRKTVKAKTYDCSYRKALKQTFNGRVSSMLTSSKFRAKKKSLPHDLDTKWLREKLLPMKCEATGIELSLQHDNSVTHAAFAPSIDRIDNSLGYTKENCRIVCVLYNKAKSDYSSEMVLKMARGLVSNNE